VKNTIMKRPRWSDTAKVWGPFTFDKDAGNHWTLLLRSGTEEYYGCNLLIQGFGRTLIINLPQILPPYREKIQAKYWDDATIARMGRNWYWKETLREIGILYFDGFLILRYGKQTFESRTEKSWSWFVPWLQWRHVRRSFYGTSGQHIASIYDATKNGSRYELAKSIIQDQPKQTFKFLDYDGEEIAATVRVEEREWRLGTGWFTWLSQFATPKIVRELEIEFSSEVGKRKGSWKGGTLAHSIECHVGYAETCENAFRRYCTQNGLTFLQ
jgi:hypothetical protein